MNGGITTLKHCTPVLNGDLPTDARIPNVYFGRSDETHRGSCAKAETGPGERCVIHLRAIGKLPWTPPVRFVTHDVPLSAARLQASSLCSRKARELCSCHLSPPQTHSFSSHSSLGLLGSRHDGFVVSLLRWTFFGHRVFAAIRVENILTVQMNERSRSMCASRKSELYP